MCKSVKNLFQLFLVCLLCLVISCNKNAVKLPIEEKKLVDILCDVHLLEGAIQNAPKAVKDSLAKLYYDQVYEKHQISESELLSSLEIMENNPKSLSKIYTDVLVRLDTLEKKSYKDKYKIKKK